MMPKVIPPSVWIGDYSALPANFTAVGIPSKPIKIEIRRTGKCQSGLAYFAFLLIVFE